MSDTHNIDEQGVVGAEQDAADVAASGGRSGGGGSGRSGSGRGGPGRGGPGRGDPGGPGRGGPGGPWGQGGSWGSGDGEGPGGPRRSRAGRHGRPGRRQRGAVRAAILSQLAQESSNGYGLIRSISERTHGAWTPSPGSIYPTLAQLVDEGLIEPAGADPGADFQLTAEGRSHVAEQAERLDLAWHVAEEDSTGLAELRAAMTALLGAVEQVRLGATPEQVAAATGELQRARRALFALLAQGPEADAGASGAGR